MIANKVVCLDAHSPVRALKFFAGVAIGDIRQRNGLFAS